MVSTKYSDRVATCQVVKSVVLFNTTGNLDRFLMETLSIDDIQKLNQGIQQLYTIHNFDTFGVDTLAIVDRLVPGEIPIFHITNLQTSQVLNTFLPKFTGLNPKIFEVIQQYFGEHPIIRQMPQTLTGVHKISDFISQQELHCLEGLYQQSLRHFNLEDQFTFFLPNTNSSGWSKLSGSDSALSGFSTHRTWGKFTERDRSILSLLQPHLLQAYTNARCHQQVQQDLNRLQQSFDNLGIVIVDLDGRIQSIALQAISWLDNYFPRSTHSFQLPELLRSWINHQVSSFRNNPTIIETRLPLRIQKGDRELIIRLVLEKSGETYILLFQEQILSLATSLKLLGLTQREVDVLLCMMQGNDNRSMAIILDIGISTVRKHLENIYLKLNVQSRTAAISRVLEQVGFLPSNLIG